MASTPRVRRLAGTAGLAVLVAAGLIVAVTHADAATSSLAAASIYVSPSGTAAGAGTESDPTNLATAITKVAAGGSIYLREHGPEQLAGQQPGAQLRVARQRGLRR